MDKKYFKRSSLKGHVTGNRDVDYVTRTTEPVFSKTAGIVVRTEMLGEAFFKDPRFSHIKKIEICTID